MKINNLTYEQAINKLEKIVSEIEKNNLTVDILSEKIKLARKLFEFCFEKLTQIEDDVTSILNKLPNKLNENL